ncbi:MAG TPA: hypothetical protein VGK89_02990 [Candidatus Eisenbacteria bacterium]
MRYLPPFLALTVAVSLAPAAFAATKLSGIEAMTATVFQEEQSSFSGLGIRVNFQSDELIPGIEFLPGLEYWRNSTKVRVTAGTIRAERRDATLSFDARYSFHYGNFAPYVGTGFGIHFLTTELSAPAFNVPRAEDSVIKGGLGAQVGLLFPYGQKLRNFVELKYHHVTDFRQLKLNMGLTYSF